MNNQSHSLFVRANVALRNKDFESAIDLYNKALAQADDSLTDSILFNLSLAEKRVGLQPSRAKQTIGLEQTPQPAAPPPETDYDNLWSVMQDIKSHFDPVFYLAKYPDIERAGIDPLIHFCKSGWREHFDPCSSFSTADYLELNHDVVTAGINPFWHYVVAGRAEGRDSAHPGGAKAKILKNLLPFDKMVQQWSKNETPPNLLSDKQLFKEITKQLTYDVKALLLSIGHDHYLKNSGGVQLCIQREEQLASSQGIVYLNVHPWQPMPKLACEKESPDPLMVLVLAGKDIGVCQSSVLTEAIKQLNSALVKDVYIVIHSLIGHSISHVKNWVRLREDRQCWFWLHDFFSLCPSFGLQRNNISFCGAPDINSNACAICVYGDQRRLHVQLIQSFFSDIKINVLSPSEAARQFWLSRNQDSSRSVTVLPHMKHRWLSRNNNLHLNEVSSSPISIGYLGGVVHHKGWSTFEKLYQNLADDPRYQFFYFGNQKPPLGGIRNVFVQVTSEDYFAMAKAIAAVKLDFVIHWANCFETFSFTCNEAIAGGAYVLTNPFSGNVASVVTQTGKGLVMPDEAGLISFFKDGAAESTAKIIRKNRVSEICKPTMSAMTLQVVNMKEAI